MNSKIWFKAVPVVLLTAVLAGCAPQTPTSPPVTPPDASSVVNPDAALPAANQPAGKEAGQETMRLVVYYAARDGLHVAPQTVTVPKNAQPAQTALELLVAGTSNPELISVVPPGTKVLGVTVKDHIAYANFDDKLVKNSPGGSTNERLLVSTIVDTLTAVPGVEKVQILVNNNKVATINGHMDISGPLGRQDQGVVQ